MNERARSGRCRHPLPLEPLGSDTEIAAALELAGRETVERLAAIPDRPRAMGAFDRIFTEPARYQELEREQRKVVGTLCNFVPEEIVLAAGAIPIRLDLGLSAAARAGARVLSADVCPVVRSLAGAQLGALPGFRAADLVVIPTSCDGKKKLARALGDQREVHTLALPPDRDGERDHAAWREEIAALARRLESLTGKRIRRGPLRDAIQLLNRRSARARELAELRILRPGVLSGRDSFLVLQASFFADPVWWIEHTGELLEELKARPAPAAPPSLRLLLTGSPVLFPDFHLLELIESSRAGAAVIVADEMCSGAERLHHTTVLDEWTTGGMIRAAADKTLLPCTCPCFLSNDDRIDRLLAQLRRAGAQGVIHHTLRLCQLYDLDLPRVSAALKEAGIPILNLYSEGGEDSAMIQNRVEAFLEMLQQKE